MTINPEMEAAREIAHLMRFPNAIEVDSFAKARIDLLRVKLPEGSAIEGKPLRELSSLTHNILICMVEHDGQILIPNGDFVLSRGDTITLIGVPGEVARFFRTIGIKINTIRNCMIVGGGEISYYLTKILLKMGIDVKIIESSKQRCEELSDEFPEASIVWGDGSQQEILMEERLENTDAFVSCTGIDEINAILSMYAQKKVHKKVITKLNHVDFNEVIQSLDLGSVVNPKLLTAQRILRYVRAAGNSLNSNVETLYRLMDGRVEALEFKVRSNASMIGKTLAELDLKPNLLIAGIIRGTRVIIPGGADSISEGDSVIVVTTNIGFTDINDILK